MSTNDTTSARRMTQTIAAAAAADLTLGASVAPDILSAATRPAKRSRKTRAPAPKEVWPERRRRRHSYPAKQLLYKLERRRARDRAKVCGDRRTGRRASWQTRRPSDRQRVSARGSRIGRAALCDDGTRARGVSSCFRPVGTVAMTVCVGGLC